MVVFYCDEMSNVVLCRRRRTRNVCVYLLLIYALAVESVIDGVVLFMFDFFCRLDQPIEISR